MQQTNIGERAYGLRRMDEGHRRNQGAETRGAGTEPAVQAHHRHAHAKSRRASRLKSANLITIGFTAISMR